MPSTPFSPPPGDSRGFRGFQDLTRYRVHDILLVSSLYDWFILSEEGQLEESILTKFLDLSIRHTPGLTHVSTGREAIEVASRERRHNLIVTSMHVGDMNALTLARHVKEAGLDVPVVLLAYDNHELTEFVGRYGLQDIEQVFLWQGDVRILLAIVKHVEDQFNVAYDTGQAGVQAIILIEDNVRFYSSYLPAIYAELMKQTRSLVPEGINLSHKLMRYQARPKILLSASFEEAWKYFSTYEENILGVISDVEFPKDGRLCREAGFEFARKVHALQPDVPIMLQSSRAEYADRARAEGASFLLKGSPLLLNELQQFMIDNFGFGDFVFRMPDGTEIARATDLKSLEEGLQTVPAASVAYHAARNHFSKWLKARTEFALAHHLRPRKVSDYPSVEDLRDDLVGAIRDYRQQRDRAVVADFDPATFDRTSSFTRIGGGSLGGKARGLAFVNHLLNLSKARDHVPGVRISVPPCVVVGTDVYDEFLADNDLRDFAIRSTDEDELLRRFLASPFPAAIVRQLESFLDVIDYPLAVRSSSLLEDSQYQPFAGIYETYLLPNNHPDRAVRLRQLLDAIRRVYVSTFSQHAKAYLQATSYRLEEEKMAVIVQKLVGASRGIRFYPNFAGVARSHNFYPMAPMLAEDGIAAVALGLGATVVDGDACMRFCPRYPQSLVQFSSVRDLLRNSQREFYALRLDDGAVDAGGPHFTGLARFGLDAAEEDRTLGPLGSTFSPENDVVYDGVSRPGVRLVTFAPILKHGVFPLADILQELLQIGVWGSSAPVEIEFAVNLAVPPGQPAEFGFLQLRPLSLSGELTELDLGDIDPERTICQSTSVLGHGKIDTIRDLVVVDFHRFDRGRSQDVALEVSRFNGHLAADGLSYVLIGVGRWGSSEPFLGIPVSWDQIAAARVIVEAGFRDLKVTPSQGTHFFQNLTSNNIGYFTVNPEAGEGFVDWEWLASQPAVGEGEYVRHLRLERPIIVMMNGKRNRGVILKP
jgi:CheY-like chemotaxis protein